MKENCSTGDYSTSDAVDILQSTWIVKRSVPSYHLSCNFESTTTGCIDTVIYEIPLERSVRVFDIMRIVRARIGKLHDVVDEMNIRSRKRMKSDIDLSWKKIIFSIVNDLKFYAIVSDYVFRVVLE